MNIFVTGGNGFIGKKIVERLSVQGHNIRMLSRHAGLNNPGNTLENVQVVKGDLTAENYSLEQHLVDCDVIIHCAGEIRNTSLMRSLHVDGTNRLIKSALTESKKIKRIIHWVQLSSVGTYGPPTGAANSNRMISEYTTPHPVGEYEITKMQSDELVMKAAETGLITYTIIRPSNVFSADMPNQSLRSLVKLIDKKLFFYIGKPGAIATYIHADDVVELLLRCIDDERAIGEIFNISNDCVLEDLINGISRVLNKEETKLRIPESIIRAVVAVVGRIVKLPLTKERINALVLRTKYPYTKLEKKLDFVPTISVQESIGEIVSRT
ncbi:MAG: NAD-dependent epimerase/dehydratase family protein [Thiohalomonadales bacterium]